MRTEGLQAQRGYKRKNNYGGGDLSTVAPNLLNREFNVEKPNTVWVTDSAHDEKYRDKQVASNFAELQNSNVRPFNVPTFLALELGEASPEKVADLKKELLDSIGDGDFSKLPDAIERNNLTETQVAEMRDLISSEIDELLGPLQYLLFDVPFLSDLEDAAADMVISEELEQRLQNGAAEIELPAEQFENSCEI